jgi:penicillin-binding protein 2
MLQLAQATATLANNGIKHKPRLILGTQDSVTRALFPAPVEPPVDLGFKPENVEVVRRAMVGVTQEGTSARVFAGAAYLSGGKTGTAQAVSVGQKEKYDARKLEEHQRDHALYIAFAPAEKPEIALALVVENAGFGAAHAAPIARRVFDYVLLGRYPNEEDLQAVQKGLAAGPIGKPRDAAGVSVRGVTDPTAAEGKAPASLFTAAGSPQAMPGALPSGPSTGPVLSAAALKLFATTAAVSAKPLPATQPAR